MARPSGSQGTGRLYPVVLNVYDLSPVNDYISWLGLGFYHSGLEIDGREWSFGSGAGSGTGVFECRPREVPAFRKAVPLGNLDMTSMQIEKAVWDLARDYPGSRYDLLRCNCNSFSGDLAARLGAEPVPSWVNRLASIGACFAWLLPRSLTGDAPVTGGGDQPLVTRNIAKPAVAFSGAGRSLREGGGSAAEAAPLLGSDASDERAAMRERAMQAAMARERRLKEEAE